MKCRLTLLWALGLAMVWGGDGRIEFAQPAEAWVDGLPLGNGVLGAMVLGGVETERIALNHTRLWRRSVGRERIGTAGKLEEFRRLFQAGRVEEAGRLMESDIMLTGGQKYGYVNPYQPLGDLWVEMQHGGAVTEYRRELDMETGVAAVSYRSGGVRYRREYFVAAAPDDVVVMRLSCEGGARLGARVRLDRTERDDAVRTHARVRLPEAAVETRAEGQGLTLAGRFAEGFEFAAAARVRSDGRVTAEEGGLRIEGAREIVIVLAMGTGEEGVAWCRRKAEGLRMSFEKMKARQGAAHGRLFRRVRLKLVGAEPYEKLFDSGRYLLISGSRPGGLPMNLQGIWNDQAHPPWDSDYHMDLNLEFNYWPAEVSNLAELHEPLFDWAEARMPEARRQARDLYGCGGIYFPIVADATGLGNPDNITWSWTGAAGWLAQHFWRHWEYGGDREFLARRAYPFLKEVAAFYVDFLRKDAGGRYYLLPSCSPENGIRGRKGWAQFTTISSTIDLEIAREVLTHAVEASDILKRDGGEAARWREVLEHLPLPRVDGAGRMSEWTEEVEAADPAHRHLSPLYGLFPGDRITIEGTPQWAAAAEKLLEYRLQFGSGSANGWSYPWRAALFARLLQGDRALEQLDEMARCCVNDNLLALVTDWRGQGRTVNWFGGRKVFQVEANLAATAAVAEMLMQSHGGVIRILPALPGRWAAGQVEGLAARGGFLVGIEWSEGRAERVKIHSRLGGVCRVRLDGAGVVVTRKGRAVRFEQLEGGVIGFTTGRGEDYEVRVCEGFGNRGCGRSPG